MNVKKERCECSHLLSISASGSSSFVSSKYSKKTKNKRGEKEDLVGRK
jgi:hypothetical protein